jgi:hypothetical protein
MTITFTNGKKVEAVLVSRTEDAMHVIARGDSDARELRNVRGTWVSEDCEPVSVEFAWQKSGRKPTITEADCVCSRELAAKLIHSLIAGESAEESEVEEPVMAPVQALSAPHFVV